MRVVGDMRDVMRNLLREVELKMLHPDADSLEVAFRTAVLMHAKRCSLTPEDRQKLVIWLSFEEDDGGITLHLANGVAGAHTTRTMTGAQSWLLSTESKLQVLVDYAYDMVEEVFGPEGEEEDDD